MKKKITILIGLLLLLITLSSCQETSDIRLLTPNCFESVCFHSTFGKNGIFFLRDKATNNMYYFYTEDNTYRPYLNSNGLIMSYEEFIECHIKELHNGKENE